jgi:hypothetical protein
MHSDVDREIAAPHDRLVNPAERDEARTVRTGVHQLTKAAPRTLIVSLDRATRRNEMNRGIRCHGQVEPADHRFDVAPGIKASGPEDDECVVRNRESRKEILTLARSLYWTNRAFALVDLGTTWNHFDQTLSGGVQREATD